MTRRPTTALLGAGRAGRALLPGLREAGYPIAAVWSRQAAHARKALGSRAKGRVASSPARAAAAAELILLAVPDRAIEGLATRLARVDLDWSRRTVIHFAGALGLDPLAPLRERRAGTAVLHPLQCLGRRTGSAVLAGSRARVEGDRRGRAVALRLARDLRLLPLHLPAPTREDRLAYHAAASLVANDGLALLDAACSLLESAGVARRQALDGLTRLLHGTLAEVDASGIAGALGGPVARGDAATLAAQLHRLRQESVELAEIHRLLSRRLVALVVRNGGSASRAVVRVLRASGSRDRGL